MSTKPCPTCGELLPVNALFCGNCGTRLQPGAAAAQPQAGPSPVFGPPPASFGPPAGQPPAPFPSAPSQPGQGPAPQGFAPPPQPGGPPPQGFGPPPQALNAPAQPGAPGFPSQPGGPAQPGFGPPPQGFAGPPPQPGRPPQGFAGPPPQPGMPPPGFAGPPAKKRRGGLIAVIVILLLVLVVGGVAGTILLTRGTPKHPTTGGSGGGTTSATATPSAPAGFQPFKNALYRVLYPKDWLAQQMPIQQGDEEQFLAPSGAITRSLTVDVFDKTRPAKDEDDTLCLGFSGNPTAQVTPTTATLGGQQWTREDCAARNLPGTPTLKAVVESVIYKDKLYTISYVSSPDKTFASDRSAYYTPMEQSFTFLT